MSKFVCDVDTVKNIGTEVCKSAENVGGYVKEYSSKIDADLSEWNSAAKTSFTTVNQAQAAIATADAEYTHKLGEFIQLSAEAIQKLDEELASSIKI